MTSWETEKALYEIHEINKKSHETYSVIMTGEEVAKWCKAKNESYGYIEGLGGDRSYGCWAFKVTY